MGRRAGALSAVLLDPGRTVGGLRDSKQLTRARRERLAEILRRRSRPGVGGALVVDELLRSAEELDITPLGLVVGRLSPRGCSGLSVIRQEPVIAIDPNEPPAVLRAGS